MAGNTSDFYGAVAQPPGRKAKRLRNAAREAYAELSGDLKRSPTRSEANPEKPSIFTYRSSGRGMNGESSN